MEKVQLTKNETQFDSVFLENVLSHIQRERELKKVYRLNGFNGKQL
jgi:hypothetical protein